MAPENSHYRERYAATFCPMNGEPQGGLRRGNLLGEEAGYPTLPIGYITQRGQDGQNQNQPEMSHDARLA